MANEEHLAILKQGVKVWNEWRGSHADVRPDLSGASFVNSDLGGADLGGADLRGADLGLVDLSAANLSKANLHSADLYSAVLHGTYLNQADLSVANLYTADLGGADLRGANLSWALFQETDLSVAVLSQAIMNRTILGNVDLSTVKGLETVRHNGPSSVGIETIYRSQGKIPEVFLRGAGVPDSFITYMHSLTGEAIKYYKCFISYSSKDEEFVRRLYDNLQGQGVRCWFAREDLKIGAEIRQGIDQAIHVHDKLLLVLSEHSVTSRWVQKEVETAFEKEQRQGKLILFPIRLDSTVMNASQAWAADICRMRNIGDFTNWKDHDAYQKAFDRLLRDLKAEAS